MSRKPLRWLASVSRTSSNNETVEGTGTDSNWETATKFLRHPAALLCFALCKSFGWTLINYDQLISTLQSFRRCHRSVPAELLQGSMVSCCLWPKAQNAQVVFCQLTRLMRQKLMAKWTQDTATLRQWPSCWDLPPCLQVRYLQNISKVFKSQSQNRFPSRPLHHTSPVNQVLLSASFLIHHDLRRACLLATKANITCHPVIMS